MESRMGGKSEVNYFPRCGVIEIRNRAMKYTDFHCDLFL